MKRLQQVTQQLIRRMSECGSGDTDIVGLSQTPRIANVLIVEDEENDAILTLEAINSVGGVSAIVARTGDEAINYLKQAEAGVRAPFDIVFVDLRLTGSVAQGAEVIRTIARQFPKCHTVIVSGQMDAEAALAMRGLYVGIVSKPIQADNLDEILRKHRFKANAPATL